ncbi:MAG: DUF4345 domain-containing protein [Ferruginibacter sp.]
MLHTNNGVEILWQLLNLKSTKLINSKNFHLTASVIIVTIVSLTYGLFPNNILPNLFDFTIDSIDLTQMFRAIMGLYLGMVALWLTGIFNPYFWRAATIANVFFMFGLASGRIISLVVDGIPSILLCAGLLLELILALWGVTNLKKYQETIKQ